MGYFVADANVCNLTLVVGESMVDDQVPTSTSARIQQMLAPNGPGASTRSKASRLSSAASLARGH